MAIPAVDQQGQARSTEIEFLKYELERHRYRIDLLKWVAVAIAAIVSFVVIDFGKLQLERFQAGAENQRQLLAAYLEATETPEPNLWIRKLQVLENFANDDRIRQWAQLERQYIEEFAALDALYRETLKVASQLIEPGRLGDPERVAARIRFDQLYWADLPYADESDAVETAMVEFRRQLLKAEQVPDNGLAWNSLYIELIQLSKILREETPRRPK